MTPFQQKRQATAVAFLDDGTRKRLAGLGLVADARAKQWVLCRDVWLTFVTDRSSRDNPSVVTYDDYRFVRRVLGAGSLPHCRIMLKDLGLSLRGQRCGRVICTNRIGQLTAEENQYVARWAKGVVSKLAVKAAPCSPEEAIAYLPHGIRDAIRAELAQIRFPPIAPPPPRFLGRAMRLPEPWRQMLLITMFRLAVEGRSNSSHQLAVASAEHLAKVVRSHPPAKAEAAILKFLQGAKEDREAASRARYVYAFAGALCSASRWLTELQKKYPGVKRPMPVEWLRRFRIDCRPARSLTHHEETKRDEETLQRLIAAPDLNAIVEARISTVRDLAEKFRRNAETLQKSGGLEARLTIHGVPSVDALAARFRIVRLDRAWQMAIDRCELSHHYVLQYRLHCDAALRDVQAGRARYVCLYLPEDREEGDEEPFFVDLYRYSLIDPGHRLYPEAEGQAAERCNELRFPRPGRRLRGVLSAPRQDRKLLSAFRGNDPRNRVVVIPIERLEGGMMLAASALDLCRDAAPRVRELLQVAVNCGNIGSHFVGHRKTPYFQCFPKDGQVEIRKNISTVTLERLVNTAKVLSRLTNDGGSNRRGGPALALVPFQGCNADQMPRRQYLFQTGEQGLRPTDVSTLLNSLLIGLAVTRVHQERALTATRVGLSGRDRAVVRLVLNHAIGSSQTPRYDRSGSLLAQGLAFDFARTSSV